MNTDKWKKLKSTISEFLQLLRMDKDFEIDDDLMVEEQKIDVGRVNRKPGTTAALKKLRPIIIILLVVIIIGSFLIYNRLHMFTDYTIAASYENEVTSGTKYAAAGKYIYRYNTDGVSCVSLKNDLKWSITYNMQAPIADVCGETMVIAEQQGNKIYIVNKKGQIGYFETLLPILKVRVSKQGVVAAVLQEENVTWVNLYQPDGTSIAENKTSISESGYPLDIDLAPDGQKLAVSYLAVDKAVLRTDIVFYHFGTAGQSLKNHVASTAACQEQVVPEIYFTDNATAVAVTDSGFIVFEGSDAPEETAEVAFEKEIVSVFHDDNNIGFLFHSDQDEYIYRMELYEYDGRCKSGKDINTRYDAIKIQNEQILMFTDENCDVFTLSGIKHFSSPYEKEIIDVFNFSEFRKYLVVTKDSIDKIRISG